MARDWKAGKEFCRCSHRRSEHRRTDGWYGCRLACTCLDYRAATPPDTGGWYPDIRAKFEQGT